MPFSRLSTRKLVTRFSRNEKAQNQARDILRTLNKPGTLTQAKAAKRAFIRATIAVLEALQKEATDLSAELTRRLPSSPKQKTPDHAGT